MGGPPSQISWGPPKGLPPPLEKFLRAPMDIYKSRSIVDLPTYDDTRNRSITIMVYMVCLQIMTLTGAYLRGGWFQGWFQGWFHGWFQGWHGSRGGWFQGWLVPGVACSRGGWLQGWLVPGVAGCRGGWVQG